MDREGFKLKVRGKFFTQTMVRCWNRLPKEVVVTPSLVVLKSRMNGALDNPV